MILWRQLIDYAKSSKNKFILFVTADKKEDWWTLEQNEVVGPRSELIREIRNEAQAELFWMYDSVQFVEHAKKYLKASVSDKLVAEMVEVAKNAADNIAKTVEVRLINKVTAEPAYTRDAPHVLTERNAEHCVINWLRERGENVEYGTMFPDLILKRGEDNLGCEVRIVFDLRRMHLYPGVPEAAHRGMDLVQSGNLSGFVLFIIIPEEEFFGIANKEGTDHFYLIINKFRDQSSVDGIIVGSLIDGRLIVWYVDGWAAVRWL